MPLERVSQGFKDISMSFENNPLTQDLIALKNENAIARSIKNCGSSLRIKSSVKLIEFNLLPIK